MDELYEDWLVRKLTPQEKRELSDEEKKERKRLKKNISGRKKYSENPGKFSERGRKWREENTEKVKERNRTYYEEHKEEIIEQQRQYRQTPYGKKTRTIQTWVGELGLQEPPEDLDRIYDLWLNQELCNACDCVLTRTGKRISTDACCDHDHDTHRFRHIICRKCNTMDNWKKYFC